MRRVLVPAITAMLIGACGDPAGEPQGKALVATGIFVDSKNNRVEAYLWRNNAIAIFNGMLLKNESKEPLTIKAIAIKSVGADLEIVGYRIVRASNLELGTPFTGICANSFPPPSPISEPVDSVTVPVGESIAPLVAVRNPEMVSHAKLEGLVVIYEQGSREFIQQFGFNAQYRTEPGQCSEK